MNLTPTGKITVTRSLILAKIVHILVASPRSSHTNVEKIRI